MTDLLDQFMTQECTPEVRRLLEDAIADLTRASPRCEFNRFEITIERHTNMVLLEDVLDPTEKGICRVPLAEFQTALERPS